MKIQISVLLKRIIANINENEVFRAVTDGFRGVCFGGFTRIEHKKTMQFEVGDTYLLLNKYGELVYVKSTPENHPYAYVFQKIENRSLDRAIYRYSKTKSSKTKSSIWEGLILSWDTHTTEMQYTVFHDGYDVTDQVAETIKDFGNVGPAECLDVKLQYGIDL